MTLDMLLTDPGFFADPYPAYGRLREEAPIFWSEAWGAWVLTRHADALAVLSRPQLFSSAGRVGYLLRGLARAERERLALLDRHYQVGLAHADPPQHTRLRALLTRVFTPRMVERLRPRVEALVEALLDAALPAGRLDVIADLAYPLPATVVAELIGAPAEDRDRLRDWALGVNELFSGGGRTTMAQALRAQGALEEMHAYVAALSALRRAEPRDDILSGLVAAEQAGERLSPAELVSTVVTLFVAGHETTTHLLGNGLLALLQHPEQLALLRERPELMGDAVEELLRYDTPVQRGWRLAVEETEIDGQRVAAGAMVLPMLGAANRDPAQFPEPERLDITRKPGRHFGFGHGIHYCLGAPLARLEVAAALSALLRRAPGMGLAPGARLVWRRDVALRGLEALPVVW